METQPNTPFGYWTIVRRLYCACCGASTRGVQCRDRDTGYGFCARCIARYRSLVCSVDRCDCFYPRGCSCDRTSEPWTGEGHAPRCHYRDDADRPESANLIAMLEVN